MPGISTVENYGAHATSEILHGLGCPQITADELVCVLSEEMYMVSVSVGVDPRTMHGHDIAVSKYSGYNLIARESLPLGWERRIVKDSKVASIAGADECPFPFLGLFCLQ